MTRATAVAHGSAIDDTIGQPGMAPRTLLLTLALGFAQDGLYGLFFLSYMNHYLLDVLKASAGTPGYTLAIFGAAKLIITPASGRLLDRTSPRAVLWASASLQVTALGLLLFHTLAGFLCAAVLLAAGNAAIWPLIYDVVARAQAQSGHSRTTGLLALVGFAAVGGGLLGGLLLGHYAPPRLFIVLALVLVLSPLALQNSPALDSRNKVNVPTRRSGQLRRSLALAAFFAVILFIDYAAVTSLAGLYGPYARRTLHISLLRTALLLMPAAVAAFAALWLASKGSKPGRRLREMALLYVLSAVGAFGLAIAPTPLVAALAAIPLAVGVGAVTPIIAASLIGQATAAERGLVFGVLMSVEGLGAVIGPAATAFASELVSPRMGLV
ncbi:MAG: MFS transporter, partial [Tepidiformaceae bacterium]